jgi:hypothetical protein
VFQLWGFMLPVVFTTVLACSTGSHDTPYRRSADSRGQVHGLLDSMARAISMRDAREIAHRMPSDSSVVYVSDGRPIRGFELRTVLENFYATQRVINFRWDSVSLVPQTDDVWTATAWAQIGLTDTAGSVSKSPAIFTWTLVRRGGRWRAVLAHKTTISRLKDDLDLGVH